MTVGLHAREDLAGLDPRKLPGLVAWFDAQQAGGFHAATPADGTAISQWTDLSGHGRHATQAIATKQPLYRKASANYFAESGVQEDLTYGLSNANTAILTTTGLRSYGGAVLGPAGESFGGVNWTQWSWPAGASYGIARHFFDATQTSLAIGTVMRHSIEVYNPSTDTVTIETDVNDNGATNTMLAPGARQRISSTATAIGHMDTTYHFADVQPQANVSTPNGAVTLWFRQPMLEALIPLSQPTTQWLPVGNIAGVQFDGIDDMLTSATGDFANALTAYVSYACLNPHVVGQRIVRYVKAGAGNGWCVGNGTQSANNARFFFYSSNNAAYGGVDPALTPGISSTIVEGSFVASTANTGTVAMKGGSRQAVNAPDVNGYGPVVGAATYLGASPFDGSPLAGLIHSVVLFSTYHDLATRRRVNNWLGRRLSVTLARP